MKKRVQKRVDSLDGKLVKTGTLTKDRVPEIKLAIEKMRSELGEDGRSLGELAKENAKDMKEDSPAVVLVNTALAINWKWALAKKRLELFEAKYPNVKSFADLKALFDSMTERNFCQQILGFNSTKKGNPRYKMLKNLVEGFLDYKRKSGFKNDWETIEKWGEQVDVDNIFRDPVAKGRPGIGLATVQNIKIVSGFDTIKPDRRVVAVLENLLNMDLGKATQKLPNAVHKVELLSKLTGYKCIELDQLFWYWYEKNQEKIDW
jgi:hypothetical protein